MIDSVWASVRFSDGATDLSGVTAVVSMVSSSGVGGLGSVGEGWDDIVADRRILLSWVKADSFEDEDSVSFLCEDWR